MVSATNSALTPLACNSWRSRLAPSLPERRLTKVSTTLASLTKPLVSSCAKACSTSSGLACAAVSLSVNSWREYSRCASKLTARALTDGALSGAPPWMS